MADDDNFVLKWDMIEKSRTATLTTLWKDGDFLDVTIACEDDQIDAHKVVLSASSTYFLNILKRNPHSHPLLFLRGTTKKEVQSLLEFMYCGETYIPQEELEKFIALANNLKVKGLMIEEEDVKEQVHSENNVPQKGEIKSKKTVAKRTKNKDVVKSVEIDMAESENTTKPGEITEQINLEFYEALNTETKLESLPRRTKKKVKAQSREMDNTQDTDKPESESTILLEDNAKIIADWEEEFVKTKTELNDLKSKSKPTAKRKGKSILKDEFDVTEVDMRKVEDDTQVNGMESIIRSDDANEDSLVNLDVNTSVESNDSNNADKNNSLNREDKKKVFNDIKAELLAKSEHFQSKPNNIKQWTGQEEELEPSSDLPEGWGLKTKQYPDRVTVEFVTPDRKVKLRSMVSVLEYIKCSESQIEEDIQAWLNNS